MGIFFYSPFHLSTRTYSFPISLTHFAIQHSHARTQSNIQGTRYYKVAHYFEIKTNNLFIGGLG